MKIKRKSRNLLIAALVVLVSITGCSSDNGIKFESSDKDFEVQLQKGFEKGDVTKTDEPEGYVYSFEREGEGKPFTLKCRYLSCSATSEAKSHAFFSRPSPSSKRT